jgi:hypothetical protein
MADTGAWNVSGDEIQKVYVDTGPLKGPLVVYRIHNDGPETVFAGNPLAAGVSAGAAIRPGCYSDLSGSPIQINLEVREGTGSGRASGTYELVCCQCVMQA